MEKSAKPEYISIYEAPRPGARAEDIDPASVEDRVKNKLAAQATKLVDRHPEDAVRVLRGWLNQDR